jgi:hypothetical protein
MAKRSKKGAGKKAAAAPKKAAKINPASKPRSKARSTTSSPVRPISRAGRL